jgi:hypothetical protein
MDLARPVWAHPTLSEAMREPVFDALGQALHQQQTVVFP